MNLFCTAIAFTSSVAVTDGISGDLSIAVEEVSQMHESPHPAVCSSCLSKMQYYGWHEAIFPTWRGFRWCDASNAIDCQLFT